MMPSSAPREPCDADSRDAWQINDRRWDSFYAIVFAAVLGVVLLSSHGLPRIVAAWAMAAMVPWYLLLGRPLCAAHSAHHPALKILYVSGLFGLFGAAQSQNPEVWLLAFAIAPQFFSFLEARLAMALGIALNFFAAALLVAQQPTANAAAVAFGVAAAGGGFSVFYGAWVSRIIEQSAERAEIIDQLATTRAQLGAAQHEAGRLAERQRLAADIHDTLAQGFTSLLMLLQAARAESDPAQSKLHLDLAEQTARENLAEARALVAGLAPMQLDHDSLPEALRRLADSADISATLELTGTPRTLPTPSEVVLLRVCQEALSNVRKHAEAAATSVRLGYEADVVRLEVSDDGKGFDPARVNGGYGLRGMRGRVTDAGGSLTVHSSPGAGTTVCASLPSAPSGSA